LVRDSSVAPAYHERKCRGADVAFTNRTKAPATVYDFDRVLSEKIEREEGGDGRQNLEIEHRPRPLVGVSASRRRCGYRHPFDEPGFARTPLQRPAT